MFEEFCEGCERTEAAVLAAIWSEAEGNLLSARRIFSAPLSSEVDAVLASAARRVPGATSFVWGGETLHVPSEVSGGCWMVALDGRNIRIEDLVTREGDRVAFVYSGDMYRRCVSLTTGDTVTVVQDTTDWDCAEYAV